MGNWSGSKVAAGIKSVNGSGKDPITSGQSMVFHF